MAEDEALVAAVGLEPAPASVAARMRHAPGVEGRVDHLGAVAGVARGDGRRRVRLPAVGAGPHDREGLLPTRHLPIVLYVLKVKRFLHSTKRIRFWRLFAVANRA